MVGAAADGAGKENANFAESCVAGAAVPKEKLLVGAGVELELPKKLNDDVAVTGVGSAAGLLVPMLNEKEEEDEASVGADTAVDVSTGFAEKENVDVDEEVNSAGLDDAVPKLNEDDTGALVAGTI